MLSNENMSVLVNIIGAVESGGQVYGKRRYNTYEPPYRNTPSEHTITIGWACNYGYEAKKLIQMIYDADVSAFRRIDNAGVESMLSKDWVAIRWNPSSAQKAVIINLIDSEIGHKCQDELFASLMKTFVSECERSYTKDVKAVMMYCEIRHLGGSGPAKRVFGRCNGDYSLASIMNSLKKDQDDKSSSNQVGDTIFWSRHVKCKEFIEKHSVTNQPGQEVVSTMTEKDIIICGHGSGTPSTKNMYTYNASRYSQLASNGKHKGAVEVLRLKGLTDAERQKFHDTYKTILGRNRYNQNLRNYCYKPYNGVYYSDCSSSVCLTFKQIGKSISALNTAAMHNSGLFEKVNVTIVAGHIQDVDKLKVADCIMYAGTDPSRPLQIGHVEAIYEMPTGYTPSNPDSTVPSDSSKASAVEAVKNYQKWLNTQYKDLVVKATGSLLAVDGSFGSMTRAASITIWKYMANKYYGARLTIGNMNFYSSCKVIAAKMTNAEVAKHPTLAVILQGLLAGRGYYGGAIDGSIGPASTAAINQARRVFKLAENSKIDDTLWYKLFN